MADELCLLNTLVPYKIMLMNRNSMQYFKASEDLENLESLAQMAALQNETSAEDGETYIEKYIKGVSGVESILTLDRLRQEVAVKELTAQQGRSLRKTTSTPNIHQVWRVRIWDYNIKVAFQAILMLKTNSQNFCMNFKVLLSTVKHLLFT